MLSILEYTAIIFLWQIVGSWLAYAHKFSWITPQKTKLVIAYFSCFLEFYFYSDRPFRGCSRMGGGQKGPHRKICHMYPVMMKLDIVTPYPKKIQKTYKSSDMLLSSADLFFFIIRKSPVIMCLRWVSQKEESAQSDWSVLR